MDAKRSDDVVDTPAPELRAKTPDIPWPSREMFLVRGKPAIKWRDLPLGIFFIHDRIDFGENDFGRCSKLQLQLKDGETFWVWGFDRLLKRLDKYPKTMFVLNDGLKKSAFSDKSYFDFLLY
jgi:hypothetical protein